MQKLLCVFWQADPLERLLDTAMPLKICGQDLWLDGTGTLLDGKSAAIFQNF
jgi:hypothetical protein